MSILKADHITIRFGGLVAVDDFDLEINQGELWAIIGPNGAGKTTVFNMLTGIYPPTEGKVIIGDQDMSGKKPYEFAAAGMARTFQNIRLFAGSSVLDNVKMAHTMNCKYGYKDMVLRTKKYKSEEDRITKESMELLDLFGLADRRTFSLLSCLTASSVSWRLSALWPPSPSCCSSTSLPQVWAPVKSTKLLS